MRGTPAGRQWASGSSLGFRCLSTSAAQGAILGVPASTVRGEYHMPERSGLPSAILGTGPDGPTRRLLRGLPSGPTMLPPGGGKAAGVCAAAHAVMTSNNAPELIFIQSPSNSSPHDPTFAKLRPGWSASG